MISKVRRKLVKNTKALAPLPEIRSEITCAVKLLLPPPSFACNKIESLVTQDQTLPRTV